MSPQIHRTLYGYFQHVFVQFERGGYWRPVVCFNHALDLGRFFAFAAFLAALPMRKELARYREAKALERTASIIDSGVDLGDGMKFLSGRVDGLSHVELKKLIDKIRSQCSAPFGVLLVSRDQDVANFVAAVDQPLLEKGVTPANEICGQDCRRSRSLA